jgi:C4-dicarboxylate transporter DctM subunit
MVLISMGIVFVIALLISLPIVFSLGASAVVGLVLGGYPLQQLGSTIISASQSWVLLAIPSFIFAGSVMEKCGMSQALV